MVDGGFDSRGSTRKARQADSWRWVTLGQSSRSCFSQSGTLTQFLFLPGPGLTEKQELSGVMTKKKPLDWLYHALCGTLGIKSVCNISLDDQTSHSYPFPLTLKWYSSEGYWHPQCPLKSDSFFFFFLLSVCLLFTWIYLFIWYSTRLFFAKNKCTQTPEDLKMFSWIQCLPKLVSSNPLFKNKNKKKGRAKAFPTPTFTMTVWNIQNVP